ncbi:MAG TPA: ABC transporter permease [bacterium]|jgi:ABC-2 type transport system permease protein
MKFLQWFHAVRYLIQKEFRQVFRDPAMLRIIFIAPLIQLFILSYAATTDVRNIRLAILDQDNTSQSRLLAQSFYQNNIFIPVTPAANPSELMADLQQRRADIAVWIPLDYAKNIAAGQQATISITINGQNSSVAARAQGYAETIVRQEANRIFDDASLKNPAMKNRIHRIEAATRFFYNPELESRYYMIPAILVILMTLIAGMLTGMAVVREKEIGTLEQLMVTPLTPSQLIAGKVIPFTLLTYFELTFATTIAVLWFGLPLLGSIPLLMLCALAYLLVSLAVGLLASEISSTQQQAMFTMWFYMIFGIMTSGFFYPIENMPAGIYYLTFINPLRYIVAINRGVFLKGAGLTDVWHNLWPLVLMGTVLFTTAVFRFRKRLE